MLSVRFSIKMSVKVYDSISWLRKRFIVDGKTIAEMAIEANCAQMTIRRALKDKGIIK